MTSRIIDNTELMEAIKIAFEGDEDIVPLYDPNEKVNSINDVVLSVWAKIDVLGDLCISKGVYVKNKLVGFYVYCESLLISFSINKDYRTSEYLKGLYELMKMDLGEEFYCRLWEKNERAIKWLVKNNMEIMYSENEITYLKN